MGVLTVSQFRTRYPAFASVNDYPDAIVQATLDIGERLINADEVYGWGDILDLGIGLYTAHNLALYRRDALTVAKGGIAGQDSGSVASKSVGGVSISYDSASASFKDAGAYNQTIYGRQFWQLMQLQGMGALQF